jgi:FkbM family methyltransferase
MLEPPAMRISRYAAKRALLTPHTSFKRRQARDLDHVTRSILESQYYRPTMYRFAQATAADPNLLVDADIDASSIVLDIGAFVGDWSEAIARRYGSRIYAFEPNPNALGKLRRRVGDNPDVQIFEIGLGARDEETTLMLDGPGSSTYATSGQFGTATVRIRDVDRVLTDLQIDHIDLCKINIEGGEYELFDRMFETGWIERTRIVSVQFHEWLPRAYPRRRAIRRALARTHEEVWNYPFVWELWRRKDPEPG